MRILLTGFGPFRDIENNPSEFYANNLQIQSCTIDRFIIDVSDEGIEAFMVYYENNAHLYDMVVMMGVAADAKNFRIEMLARDILPINEEMHKSPPRTLLSTLSFSNAIWQPYIKLFSYNAGTYYCNYLYFLVLERIHSVPLVKNGKFMPAVFVHVPCLSTVTEDDGLQWLISFVNTALHQ